MHIELKKIDKDTLKVGDVVGVAREVSFGWESSFRHQLITPAKITRITPKRTKIETDQFGEHDKNEIFYEYDENAEKENELAIMFKQIKDRRRAFDGKCLEAYLVTKKYGSSAQDKAYPFRAFWDGINFTDGWRILDVIAWMPLPEPYKGEGEDAE